ncbi:AAA family ATPase [Streptomyces sp. NPDC051940]|uniref:ATP-binding protein n=1 Tax=Streptomyces sp. NPDC051940 TaxID=3155675 RepID=UPI0034460218
MSSRQPKHHTGNVPPETGELVGRERELARLQSQMERSRVVTLTGPGGVGKTRLALHAARRLRSAFPDGVWWIELSGLRDGALLAHTIAEALPLADQSARPMTGVLGDYLSERRLLLVLDTCEHLTDACAFTLGLLLRASPGTRVLTTSRRPLGMAEEDTLVMEPLPVPDEHPSVVEADAMVLLAERAAEAVPGFAVTPDNRADLAQLCRRLEGLPLAIELAAPRLRDMSPTDLAARLEDRFAVLGDTGGPVHDADPPWHQALRTAIGWSHQLCTPAERLLWARLSVFAGTFDAESARLVCSDAHLTGEDVERLLPGLVRNSLVTWVPTAAGERYRMLDTIREYGEGWLRRLGEDAEFHRRHRDRYLALAREGNAAWLGPDQFSWYDRVHAEAGNLRVALDFTLAQADGGPTALEFAGDLYFLWYACGLARDGRHYLERALSAHPAPGPERVTALFALGLVLTELGDVAVLQERSAQLTAAASHYGATEADLATCVAICAAALRGDPLAVLSLADAHLAEHQHDDRFTVAGLTALAVGSHARIAMGRSEEALGVLDELRAVCDKAGERWMRAWGDSLRSQAELALGRFPDARRSARASLEVKQRMHDSFGIGMCMEALAQAAVAVGEGDHAAYLLGVAQQHWDTLGRPQIGIPTWVAAHEECERQVREALGELAYGIAFDAGCAAEADTGVALALSGTGEEDAPE